VNENFACKKEINNIFKRSRFGIFIIKIVSLRIKLGVILVGLKI